MENLSFLQTFADVAIATSAMSAILIALQFERMSEPRFIWGLSALFSWSLAALFFSLFPMVLYGNGVEITEIWKYSFSGITIHGVAHTLIAWFADRKLTSRGIGMRGKESDGPIAFSPLLWFAYVVITTYTISVLLATLFAPTPGNYFLALIVQIGFAFWTFLLFMFPLNRNAA